MKLHLNCEIGKDIAFAQLEKEFDAIYLGIGATKSNYAKITGEDAKGVHLAIDFLTEIQKRNFGTPTENFIDVKDKTVLVIGGGDTAMDCVRSSVREGASSVKCLYRRDEANMPGSKKEVINSKEEGVEFMFNVSPKEIKVENGNVVGVELFETVMSQPDANGRQKVEILEESNFVEEADVVILALGFSPEQPTFLNEANIEMNAWGGIVTNNFKTSNPKIYAGGDCQRGAHLAVTAAADGRDAAKEIIKDLA
jgi:glutamate synthase (NADPH/NADH) small chain